MARPKKSERANIDETRNRILDVAEVIIAQKGFNGATTREIAESADINKNLIFYYFKNKDGLNIAVMDRLISPIYTHIAQSLKKQKPINDVIESIIDAYFSVIKKKQLIFAKLIAREQVNEGKYISQFLLEKMSSMIPLWKSTLNSEKSSAFDMITYSMIVGAIVFPFMSMPILEKLVSSTDENMPSIDDLKTEIRSFILKGIVTP
jgi:AcrR family transcriptional regulator